MIRDHSQQQIPLAEFDWPFQTALDENNRWVKLSQCIPWDELAEGYYQSLSQTQGRPAKNARLVIGAVIIKHKLCLADRETVAQIQENPYLQYFVGLPGFQMDAPFAPSLFVDIRKRMGASVFEIFHRAIITAVDQVKAKKSSQPARCEAPAQDDDDPPPASSGGMPEPEQPDHQGKLILDATVAPQAIRYPTDLNLLNEARQFSEQIIDVLYAHTELEQKPRTYRQNARKAYLAIVSISQPYVRPIIRGKQDQAVEFGAKLSVSLTAEGLARVDQLRWDAFHEGGDLIAQVEAYRTRYGVYPEAVLGDPLYGTQANRHYLKDKGIRFAGKPLGRPRTVTDENREELKRLQLQRREEYRQRIPIEGKIGQGKGGYRLNYIRAKRADTSAAWINSIFLVMKLQILLRIFFARWNQGAAAACLPLWRFVERVMRDYRRVLCTGRAPGGGILAQTAAF